MQTSCYLETLTLKYLLSEKREELQIIHWHFTQKIKNVAACAAKKSDSFQTHTLLWEIGSSSLNLRQKCYICVLQFAFCQAKFQNIFARVNIESRGGNVSLRDSRMITFVKTRASAS